MIESDRSAIRKRDMKVISGGNQMSLIRDTDEILKFLEFTSKKSILDEHAVQCRLTACHNLFSVVTEDEDNIDYMLSNLEVFVNRFKNKNKITNEATLRVYKSRTKSSIEDYKSWSADPFAWERSLLQKQKASQSDSTRGKRSKKIARSLETKPVDSELPPPPPPPPPAPITADPASPSIERLSGPLSNAAPVEKSPGEGTRFAFPLRSNFSMELKLPEDGISWKEYQRIGLFLYAYCKDVDFDGVGWVGRKQSD